MYEYKDCSKPPFIDISLPPAIVLHPIQLIVLYALTLGLDLYFLYHEQRFQKYISPKQLRLGMALVHTLIPMVFISGYPPADLLFAAVPWFLASYSAHIPTDKLNIFQWIDTISRVIIDDNEISKNKSKVRYKGLSKLSLGVFKIAVMHLIVDPLLPRRPEYALEYAFFSLESLAYTALFGIKAYLLLGVLEIYMSIYQVLFAWNIVDLFDSPIISSSPRDFWSRRWNKIVRNLLHSQVFTRGRTHHNDDDEQISAKPNKPSLSAPTPKKVIAKKKTIKKVATTTTTTTITKRVTRSSAKASSEAFDDASTHITNDMPAATLAQEDEEVNNNVTEQHIDADTKPQSFWSTKEGRGILSFVISGLFHELIIMSVCRKITLENFVFFTMQGIVVAIEVQLRQGTLKQNPRGTIRLLCIALQFIFMSATDITLPQPYVIPTLHLAGLYTCMLGIDYVLLRNQKKLVFISKKSLRIGMTVAHAVVPLAVVSPFPANNVTFAAVPWFLASYSAYLPTEEFSLKQWIQALYSTIVDRNADVQNVHRMGLVKALRGVLKVSILYFGVEPLLPTMPDEMLNYLWFSQKSLSDTFLFGLKAYLILGAVDITSGLAQAITGWCMADMFDSPLLSTSPRDFWSNRWNRTVRNLLHSQVFNGKKLTKSKDNRGFLSTKQGRGFLAFVVSGVFHELIIWSVCRKVTLENLSFFTIHGIACMLEVCYFNNHSKDEPPKGLRRIGRIIAQLSFMTVTGRLFLAPFLRYRFTEVLPLST